MRQAPQFHFTSELAIFPDGIQPENPFEREGAKPDAGNSLGACGQRRNVADIAENLAHSRKDGDEMRKKFSATSVLVLLALTSFGQTIEIQAQTSKTNLSSATQTPKMNVAILIWDGVQIIDYT